MLSEPLQVVAEVASVLDKLGVAYLVGGSLASSMYGIPRSTQDVDIAAALLPSHADAFVHGLEAKFHIDPQMVVRSIQARGSFNFIHRETLYKVDIFVTGNDARDRLELERARTELIEVGGAKLPLRFGSPEDILLHKLVWYRMGGEVSERQVQDVRGLLEVQGAALDQEYLKRYAAELRVDDLLQQLQKRPS